MRNCKHVGCGNKGCEKTPSCLAGKTEHNYYTNENGAGECKKCGLLRTTIVSIAQQDLGEFTKPEWENEFDYKFVRENPTGEKQDQWFLLDYITAKEMKEFILKEITKARNEGFQSAKTWGKAGEKSLRDAQDYYEKRLEEYRNSPDVWKNVGISKWRNWGEKCGYFDYLSDK